MKDFQLGTLWGLQVSAAPSAFNGLLALGVLAACVAWAGFGYTIRQACALGAAAVALHVGAIVVHHLGHAWAARRAGHPMRGLRFWGLLATSRYPADEPPLPARVHLQRALGGPAASALLTALTGALTAVAWGLAPGWLCGLLLFATLDNLLVFTLQAFIPLGFNDGSTLRHWRQARGQPGA